MTWSEFNTAVRVLLLQHNRRQGIQSMIDVLIKAAVVDLQETVPALRDGHTTVYTPSRFVTDGFAGRSNYQVGATIVAAYARDPNDHTVMYDFELATSHEALREMTSGSLSLELRRMAIDPVRGHIRVVPNPVEDTSEVVLVWNGKKTDFESDDDVPFDDQAVHATAEFVLARLSRSVDGDPELARSYAGSYSTLKRRIKSAANAARNVHPNGA